MVKMGRAEETVDIQLNQERERFGAQHKAIKKMNKDALHLLAILRDLSVQQNTMAENFHEVFETKAEMYNAVLKHQDTAKMIDNARTAFDEQLRGDFVDPVSKYIGQYKEIKLRIAELQTRRVDMDRYGRDVRSLQEKATNRSKLTVAEQKLEAAKANYAKLNEELQLDLPRLHEDRLIFFNPAFATYLSGMAEYYRQAAKATQEIVGYVNHIDRAAIHNHPRITTPREASSASFKATVGTGASSTSPSSTSSNDPYASVGYDAPPASAPPTAPKKDTPTPPPKKLQAKALFDFSPSESNELPFKFNDILVIHNTKGDWWEGELNGQRGLLPSNYVQLLE